MKKLTIFTRFLKGWTVTAGAAPVDAAKVIEIETTSNLGWRLSKPVAPVDPDPEPEPETP